ncbi:alpha/beta fold hydrolase [Phaeobacter sp. B1627]|uniref:alpha/beta hydrolase n=1 Tax=Phaeobacter sp. B1627 TaxID=2583809 RepID=UPI00111A44BD|nr:alpha/beta fold hydrolase [Phaeobacter sp. B1627]TNJ40811.1 hypothetical protein FGE21_16375 [Phaeobacter sp. B1627]
MSHDAFDIVFHGEVIGSTHTLCRREEGGWALTNWLELLEVKKLNQRGYRRRSNLLMDADFRPAYLSGSDDVGNSYKLNGADMQGAEFAFESNMIGQFAALSRHQQPGSGFRGTAPFSLLCYLFDACRTLELVFERDGAHWVSNINERFLFEDGVLQELQPAAVGVSFVRTDSPCPDWSIAEVATEAEYEFPPQLKVSPVQFGSKDTEAVFVSPEAPYAEALFIGGSGRFDMHGRHGNQHLGYGQLLDQLALSGLASLRYDRLPQDPTVTPSFSELQSQASEAWTSASSLSNGLPKLIVGHSLGALIALNIASNDPSVDGLILIAAPGRPLKDVLQSQFEWMVGDVGYSDGEIAEVEDRRNALLDALFEPNPDAPLPDEFTLMEPAKTFLRELIRIDPIEMLKGIKCPLVLADCEYDVQVLAEDTVRLRDAARSYGIDTEHLRLQHVNHILQEVADREDNAIFHYFDPDREISTDAIEQISIAAKKLVQKHM